MDNKDIWANRVTAGRTVDETELSLFNQKIKKVQPGDQVGNMRAKKTARAQAAAFHRLLQDPEDQV